MSYKSDIEIAQEAEMLPITEIAAKLDIPSDALELYGNYKAKINVGKLPDTGSKGKVILVTAPPLPEKARQRPSSAWETPLPRSAKRR